MIFGIDYLAGAKYPDLVLKNHPKGWAAGFFDRTFGDVYPLVKALSESGKCPLIRIHLCWSDDHIFNDAQVQYAIGSAKRFNKLSGHSRIEFSPVCEHNIKDPTPLLCRFHDAAPTCTIINTPWKGGLSAPFKLEKHGDVPSTANYPNNYSFDGTDCFARNIKSYIRDFQTAEVFFLWTPRLNLLKDSNDHTPRPKRTALPDKMLLQKLQELVK